MNIKTNFNVFSSPEAKSAAKKRVTVHNNPRWKEELRSNFHEFIIEKCSKITIDAVKGNETVMVELIAQV